MLLGWTLAFSMGGGCRVASGFSGVWLVPCWWVEQAVASWGLGPLPISLVAGAWWISFVLCRGCGMLWWSGLLPACCWDWRGIVAVSTFCDKFTQTWLFIDYIVYLIAAVIVIYVVFFGFFLSDPPLTPVCWSVTTVSCQVRDFLIIIKDRLCNKMCLINASWESKSVWQNRTSESLHSMSHCQTMLV